MKPTIGTLSMFTFFIGLFIASCKTSSTSDESGAATDTTAIQSQAANPITICMLNEAGIRDTPGESGKYLTTLYLSEQVTLIGDSAMATTSGKEYLYYKIQLEDGKQGWVRKDFIAKDVVPAVFTAATSINKRPDLASVTDKNFAAMDFVATRPAKDNWVEVTGIPTGEKWFIKGYVHADNLTYDPTDVSFAALFKRASGMKDPEKGNAMMTQLRANKDLQASQFYASLFGGEEGTDY
ncbi:MAG: SH3 domain-containing protein [Bacteroidota bacterium]